MSLVKKKIIKIISITFLIFLIDRFSKIYILSYVEKNEFIDLYITSFLNIILVWNTGVGFGLLPFESTYYYNAVTLIIILINLIILFLIFKSKNLDFYFYLLILGGSLGNLYDRIYFSAVPDYIDFHIGKFHWFVFNVADIFISIGIFCLIFVELILNKKKDEQ